MIFCVVFVGKLHMKQAVCEAATVFPARSKLTFDLLTLKVVSESRVTWVTSVPILVLLGLSVLDLGPMYATDVRQTSDALHRLMPPTRLAVWCSGNALVSINAVALHRARLVLGWVTAFGQVNCLVT